MTYDEFVVEMKELGMMSLLPDYFNKIDDEAIYTPKEIAEYINYSPAAVRIWCKNKQIPSEGISHYKLKGIDVKRFLFSVIDPPSLE